MEAYSEIIARRMAAVLGPSSAHALALTELERRRALGEDVVLLLVGRRLP